MNLDVATSEITLDSHFFSGLLSQKINLLNAEIFTAVL